MGFWHQLCGVNDLQYVWYIFASIDRELATYFAILANVIYFSFGIISIRDNEISKGLGICMHWTKIQWNQNKI